ncbi:MAG TPA: hypothetical protein PK098_12040 [Phycisphaerales bacterium]|nr:hypothetical protein [Phycisphaerales bacterium]
MRTQFQSRAPYVSTKCAGVDRGALWWIAARCAVRAPGSARLHHHIMLRKR